MTDKKELSEIFNDPTPPVETETEQKVDEVAVEKKEPEAEPKPEKKEVDWEKRNKDTFKAFQETQKLNKELQAKLDTALARLDEHDKELFPHREPEAEPKKEGEDEKWKERVILSEELVRSTYSDYDTKIGTDGDKEAPYIKAIEENPSLYNRVKAAKNPALEAYNIAKEYEFQATYGRTPEQIKAKVREEILAELAKEQKTKEKASNEDDNTMPQTLRGKGGSAPASSKAVTHRPLSALFDR